MNKYLEKIAGFGGAFNKAVRFGKSVAGTEARSLRRDAEAVARHAAAGHTPKQVERLARVAGTNTAKDRVKLGAGVAAAGGAGFLGVHRYHQHKDRAIMDRLNTMYQDNSGT